MRRRSGCKHIQKTPERETPVRKALKPESSLQSLVSDGIGSVQSAHHSLIDQGIRSEFGDSLDIDDAFKEEYPQENRWDYLLGATTSGKVFGLEPHSAKKDQVSTVINKRRKALDHLRKHMANDQRVADWFWVASGNVHFPDTDKVQFQLNQNGIKFVGKTLKRKDIS